MKIIENRGAKTGILAYLILFGLVVFFIAGFYLVWRHNIFDFAGTPWTPLDSILLIYMLIFGAILFYHKHRREKSEADAAKAVAGDFVRMGTKATVDSIIYMVAIVALLVLLFLVATLLTPDYHF